MQILMKQKIKYRGEKGKLKERLRWDKKINPSKKNENIRLEEIMMWCRK